MFDHTIEGLTLQHENFTWMKEGIAARSQPAENLYTLADHVERFAAGATGMILKIDVEGAEWDVLAIEIPAELLCRFDQIVMELHDFRLLGSTQWRDRAVAGLGKLAQYFTLHSVHGNNHAPIVLIDGLLPVADVIEVSYIRRDLAERKPLSIFLPSHLDSANDPSRPDLPLLFFPFLPQDGSIGQGTRSEALGSLAGRIDQGPIQHRAELQLVKSAQQQSAALSSQLSFAPPPASGSALRILCVSVHPVLEFDEIQLFEAMGHSVFSLGFYLNRAAAGDLRPPLPETDWHRECRSAFGENGCGMVAGAERWRINRAFCARFDVVVVHHNHHFVAANWDELKGSRIVWRTIGQETHWAEDAMRAYRDKGVKIVRWSPEERYIDRYIGADAIIRASKDPNDWRDWRGELKRIITFNNNFRAREAGLSFDFHHDCVSGLPFDLYGLDNADIEEWRGVADYSEQRELLRSHRVAFITGSIPAPYTLGFIEAWMTGIPVVHIGRQRFSKGAAGVFEIDHLIVDGESGFLVEEVDDARSLFAKLLADDELCSRISANGRAAAIKFFGQERAVQEWAAFFRDHITC